MASAETRDVVKRYELQCNPLIHALRPGGPLASVEVSRPCEALLIPRQVSLDAVHIAAYLEARPQRSEAVLSPLSSPAPPLSALFGEGHDTPDRGEKSSPTTAGKASSGAAASSAVASPSPAATSPSGVYYSPHNEAAFRAALTTFLEYHLLHFDAVGTSEFTTLRGQRGAFSEDLDHVKRFGYVGQVAVLADADPLQPDLAKAHQAAKKAGATVGAAAAAAGGAKEKPRVYQPAALQIFIIDRPLMETEEVRHIIESLRKLTLRDPAVERVSERLNALFGDAPSQKLVAVPTPPPITAAAAPSKSMDLPYLMSAINASSRPPARADAAAVKSNHLFTTQGHAATAVSPGAKRGSISLVDVPSDNESVAETIIIDDFEDDPPADPDLAPYVSKYTQISERQRRQSETTRGTDSAVSSAVVRGRAVSTDGQQVSGAPSLHGVVNHADGRRCGSVGGPAQVTAQMVTSAPPASSTSTSMNVSRDESAEHNSANSRGRVGAVARGATLQGTAANVSPQRAKVLRHEYSRECIKDYRRVVAADNEIFYHVFEHLMALRCSATLAKMMSNYVAQSQQVQQPILNNVKYNKFIASCHAIIQQVPRFAHDPQQLVILHEGIERYVTSRLYHQLYSVCEDEKRQNAILQDKFARLENMTAEELEALPEVERHHVWGQAMFELDGMDFFKSPREKLRCGMRACELLSLAVGDILRQRRNAKNPGNRNGSAASSTGAVPLAFGADEFLPCFLLLVLRARPLNYAQNISYIEKFRYASLMSPEESYCFATLQSGMMFWLNCKDDGRMDASPPATGTTPSVSQAGTNNATTNTNNNNNKSRGSVSMKALTTTSAPPLTEKDLLPSVRQASYTARAQATPNKSNNNNNNSDGASLSGGVVVAQEESPTVLDVLFGWANRNLAPIAEEISRSSVARKAAAEAGTVPVSEKQASSSAATVTSASPSPTPQGRVVAAVATATAAHPPSSFHEGHDVTVSALPSDDAPSPPRVRKPDANTRALTRELLVMQKKTFEQLTLTEIQMIVEEARQLLMEKQ